MYKSLPKAYNKKVISKQTMNTLQIIRNRQARKAARYAALRAQWIKAFEMAV